MSLRYITHIIKLNHIIPQWIIQMFPYRAYTYSVSPHTVHGLGVLRREVDEGAKDFLSVALQTPCRQRKPHELWSQNRHCRNRKDDLVVVRLYTCLILISLLFNAILLSILWVG